MQSVSLNNNGGSVHQSVFSGQSWNMVSQFEGSKVNSYLATSKVSLCVALRNLIGRPELITPLCKRSIENIQALLENEPTVDSMDKNEMTVLMHASKCGDVEVVKALLKAGATVDLMDNNEKTALMYASLMSQTKVTKLLIEAGANVELVNFNGRTAVDYAIENQDYKTAVTLILFSSVSNDFRGNSNKYKKRYLDEIVNIVRGKWDSIISQQKCDYEKLFDEISKCIELNIQIDTQNGYTVFMSACQNGHIEIINLLIASGEDVNACDTLGNTLIMHAIFSQNPKVLELLIKNGAQVNVINIHQYTSLRKICSCGNLGMLNVYLNHEGDVNLVGTDKVTGLMEACMYNEVEIVKLLLQVGAKVDVIDGIGKTALQYAEENGRDNIIEILKSHNN